MDVTYRPNKFQWDILTSAKKIIAGFKGVGCGGTDVGSHWVLKKCGEKDSSIGLIGANTYGQLRDATLKNFERHLNDYGIAFVHNKSTNIYYLPAWNSEILCRSMDNFEVLAGIEVAWYWVDEAWASERNAFNLLNARLRQKGYKLQGLLTSTTDELSSWLYDFFIAGANKNGGRDIDVFHGQTYDNIHNLPEGYVDFLRATYDPSLFKRMVEAEWLSLAAGKMFYQFSRGKHVRRLDIDRGLPLLVSSDFNLNPMSWSIWQQHRDELWCIDTICVSDNADTELCCRELKNRYFPESGNEERGFNNRLIWYGDSTGAAHSTKSRFSDYEIIRRFFTDVHLELKVPYGNPSVRDSANATNARLLSASGKVNVFFDSERCLDVILSVEGAKYRPGTLEKDDRQDSKPDTRIKTHFADTVRYIVNELYPIRPKAIAVQYTK